MQAVEIRERFGLDHLVACERDDPVAEPGQVVLRMRAASVNYRDLLMVRGHYDPKQRLPLIPGSDGVGEVVAVGEGVKRVKPGDRVCPIFAQRWIDGRPTRDRLRSTLGGPLDGTFAELVALDAEGVVRVPEHLTDDEAATLPCAGVTAFNAVVKHGRVSAGQTVLVQGTGGVSTFALQLATLAGARVIVTSSSDQKLERAHALGAWKTINYRREPNWGREARAMTEGEGVDLVVEVGGAGTFEQSVSALRFGGRIALIGTLAGGRSEINLIPVFMRQIRVQGVLVGSREDFEALNRAVEVHCMRPPVSRIFPLGEARAALEHLADHGHFGKVCLSIP